MKNIKKSLSVIMSGIMALSMFGGLTVNAEEAAEEKKYKLSELMPMSKEEFCGLEEYAEKMYNYYNGIFNKEDGLRYYGYVFQGDCRSIGNDKDYKPYYTEKEINDLLDTEFEHGVNVRLGGSPLIDNRGYYWWIMTIGMDAENYDGHHDVSDEEWILKFAKTNYCINQVYPFYYGYGRLPASKSVLYGDANGDEKLTISDAAFIAKKIAGRKTEDFPKEADINGDGKVNLKDSVYIARFMNAKHLAKAAGWIK